MTLYTANQICPLGTKSLSVRLGDEAVKFIHECHNNC